MRPIAEPLELSRTDAVYARIAELAKTAGCRDWQCAAVIVDVDGNVIGEGTN
ncbi:MAG: hypothetical protein QG650_948 [Patescibacteria group bacterium]|nr:hypothetical protein [Patescibacteria group bacterium]